MSSNTTSSHPFIGPTTLYGYVPTFWICCTFVTLFSVTTVIHLLEAVIFKPRLYWLIPTTALCGIGEVIGWSARLWSSQNPENQNAYLMQITTTIISPVFLTAALYTILGLIIDILGCRYSRLKPKTYLKVFVSADVFALVVQSAGGAMASGAKTHPQAELGSNIMLGGIFLQMVFMLCYTFLAAECLVRFYLQKPLNRERPAPTPRSMSPDSWMTRKDEVINEVINDRAILPPRVGLMVLGLALATLLVFVRTFYRTVELADGWSGYVIRTQVFFNVLDATPIFIALFVLNFLSPAFLLRKETQRQF